MLIFFVKTLGTDIRPPFVWLEAVAVGHDFGVVMSVMLSSHLVIVLVGEQVVFKLWD